jgi:RNA polymerase sigma-70 factor (ECF subfamily)
LDFAELFQHYYPRVYNYLRYRVDSPESAEDLTSVTFERAYAHRAKFNAAKGAFSTWLFRIAHNTLANYHRTRQRRMAHEIEGGVPSDLAMPDLSPEAQVIQAEAITRLLQGQRHLSQRDQEVISFKFAAELSNREIGQIMGLSEKTVSVVLWRAMQRLHQLLKGEVT